MIPELSLNGWLRFDSIRRSVESAQPARILEIGMGQGALGAWLATKASYTGVEPDEASRRIAAARIGDRGAVLTEVPDDVFDLVCAFEVLEHIEDDEDALAGWSQALRPGGQLLLSVPAGEGRFGASDRRVGHFRRYERHTLVDVVEAAGYSDIEVQAYGFPLGYGLEAIWNRIAEREDDASDRPMSVEDRTASSGRLHQVRGLRSRVLALAALPFRVLQRPFASTDLGTGWVLVARRP